MLISQIKDGSKVRLIDNSEKIIVFLKKHDLFCKLRWFKGSIRKKMKRGKSLSRKVFDGDRY